MCSAGPETRTTVPAADYETTADLSLKACHKILNYRTYIDIALQDGISCCDSRFTISSATMLLLLNQQVQAGITYEGIGFIPIQ
jgi:hypothetical protein